MLMDYSSVSNGRSIGINRPVILNEFSLSS
jgi:hypothetical protein